VPCLFLVYGPLLRARVDAVFAPSDRLAPVLINHTRGSTCSRSPRGTGTGRLQGRNRTLAGVRLGWPSCRDAVASTGSATRDASQPGGGRAPAVGPADREIFPPPGGYDHRTAPGCLPFPANLVSACDRSGAPLRPLDCASPARRVFRAAMICVGEITCCISLWRVLRLRTWRRLVWLGHRWTRCPPVSHPLAARAARSAIAQALNRSLQEQERLPARSSRPPYPLTLAPLRVVLPAAELRQCHPTCSRCPAYRLVSQHHPRVDQCPKMTGVPRVWPLADDHQGHQTAVARPAGPFLDPEIHRSVHRSCRRFSCQVVQMQAAGRSRSASAMAAVAFNRCQKERYSGLLGRRRLRAPSSILALGRLRPGKGRVHEHGPLLPICRHSCPSLPISSISSTSGRPGISCSVSQHAAARIVRDGHRCRSGLPSTVSPVSPNCAPRRSAAIELRAAVAQVTQEPQPLAALSLCHQSAAGCPSHPSGHR